MYIENNSDPGQEICLVFFSLTLQLCLDFAMGNAPCMATEKETRFKRVIAIRNQRTWPSLAEVCTLWMLSSWLFI